MRVASGIRQAAAWMLAAGTLLSSRAATVLFQDDFETDSSANWTVVEDSGDGTPDYTVDWAFDYGSTIYTLNGATSNIPSAPGGTGTKGVKLTVNHNDETAMAAAVNLYLKGRSFSNNFALRFDLWINYNGGAYGGSGSTEFAIFGIDHLGMEPNWAAPAGVLTTSDGVWFALTGEGGAARDYRNYEGDPIGAPLEYTGTSGGFLDRDGDGTVEQETVSTSPADYPLNLLFPSPPFETLAAPGKSWVQVEIRQVNGTITWLLNGYVIAEKLSANGWAAGTIMLGMMDIFNSIANPRVDNFVLFDNVRVLDLGSDTAPARLTLTASQSAAGEPGTPGEFLIERTGDTASALEISLQVSGTAAAGRDFQPIPLTTNLAAGASSLSIPVQVINDAAGEPVETVKLNLRSNPAQYEVFAPMVGTVEIADDGDVTFVGITALDTIIDEGISKEGAVFSIFRIGDTSADTVVNFGVTGTATAGADFTALEGPAVIPAGATNVLVLVDSLADAVVDTNETIIVTLQAGDGYTVIATNSTVTATIREPGPVLFSDSFETNSAANYNLRFGAANNIPDYRAEFGFDFTTANLPPSPSGSTMGLLLTVNKDDATGTGAASVNVYPKAFSFTGDYLLKADMFLNFGTDVSGTTEHATFGINHSGALTNRYATAGSDGVWFAVETDGSATGGRSYVVFTPADTTAVPPWTAKPADDFVSVFTVPPYLAAGAPSGAWVDVSVRQEGNIITWQIENHEIFRITNSGPFTSGTVMLGFMDTFNSVGSTNNFVVFDNLRVISLGGGLAPVTGTITITGTQRNGQNIVIDFTTTGSTAGITVVSSETVDGTYTPEAAAQVQTVSSADGTTTLRATVPITTRTRFFQIRQ